MVPGLGKGGRGSWQPETMVTLQGGLGPCQQEDLTVAVAWHRPQGLQHPPVSPPRAGRFHTLPGLPDERRFLRVIKPSPLGTMGPYPAVSFT